MLRTGAAAVSAAVLLALAACAGPAGQPGRSAAAPSTPQAMNTAPALLAQVPAGLAVPDGFVADGGFALHTVVGGAGTDGAVRDTEELLPQGLAFYGTDPAGHPVLELVSLAGRSQWRHEIADPPTHDGQPAVTPSLLSVTQNGTTWVVLVERGAEPGGRSDIMRLSTFNAATGHRPPATGQPGGTARQPGAGHGLATRGGDIAITVEDARRGRRGARSALRDDGAGDRLWPPPRPGFTSSCSSASGTARCRQPSSTSPKCDRRAAPPMPP